MAKVSQSVLADVLSRLASGQDAILAALTGGQTHAQPSTTVHADGGPQSAAANQPTIQQIASPPQAAKPAVPLLSSLEHPCDNSKRKVKMLCKVRQDDGSLVEELQEKNVLLRDETRKIIEPLLQQQLPLLQFRLVLHGQPTDFFLNLKCGRSASGNLQYSSDKATFALPIVDSAGQHATVDVASPAGIYLQANQVTAYPRSAAETAIFDRAQQTVSR